MKRPYLAALILSALVTSACTPVVNQRGYLPDPENDNAIKVGTDTKTTVQQRIGYPSTLATFGGDTWYYISSTERRVAFFTPTTTARGILAIGFDKEAKVTSINRYSLKDGNVVAFEDRITPTKGREITFLQQLFNASPGIPIGNGKESNPGGGGGPPQ